MIVSDLAKTYAAAFPNARGWSAQEFSDLLSQNGVFIIGDTQSFVLVRKIADEIEILTLATAPSTQRKGRASRNLRNLVTQAKADGVRTIFLEVAADNHPAHALYSAAGFAQIGSRPAYYARTNGPAVDALILQKKLDPA